MKTLFELLGDYVQHERSLNYSGCTVRCTFYNVRRFLKWAGSRFGVVTPDQIGASHMEAWQKHLAAYVTSKGQPMRPRTVNKQIESVRGFLKRLAIQGYVPAALPMAVTPIKEPRVLPGSTLAHQQMRKLLDNLDTSTPEGYRDRTILEMLYSSGIRAGEVLGLNVEHVDHRNGTAFVTGKGRKDRVVPVGKTALNHIEGYVKAVRPHLLKDNAEKALFLDMNGKRYPYHQLRRMIHRYEKKAGLSMAITPHTFRRSCTTEMLRGGAGMYHIKEMLGHESLDTLKHYAKLTIIDLKSAHARCHPREKDGEASSG
jgi:site-specific recombinase XerD